MDMDFRFENATLFAERLAAAPGIVRDEMIVATNRSLNQGIAMAVDKITENKSVVTGDMRRSVGVRESASFVGGVASGSFGPSVDYAKLVEDGREAIVAREGGALVFVPHEKYGVPLNGKGKFKGMAVYKRVKKADPKPFMAPTAEKLKPVVRDEFRGAVKRMIARLTQ